MAMGDQYCPYCNSYVYPNRDGMGSHCKCPPLSNSFTTYQVPIPNWLNKEQQRKFASKHIEMQKGSTQAAQEIDDMFTMLIDGYKLNKELSEHETEKENI